MAEANSKEENSLTTTREELNQLMSRIRAIASGTNEQRAPFHKLARSMFMATSFMQRQARYASEYEYNVCQLLNIVQVYKPEATFKQVDAAVIRTGLNPAWLYSMLSAGAATNRETIRFMEVLTSEMVNPVPGAQ